jgi:hypothetical protein
VIVKKLVVAAGLLLVLNACGTPEPSASAPSTPPTIVTDAPVWTPIQHANAVCEMATNTISMQMPRHITEAAKLQCETARHNATMFMLMISS